MDHAQILETDGQTDNAIPINTPPPKKKIQLHSHFILGVVVEFLIITVYFFFGNKIILSLQGVY